MTATLTPTPKQQFFDANGNPLVGGKLYSYSAGTTSPVVTYVDSAGVTTNTNPIILDSRGEANVWLGTGTFKFKLVSATDVEIWTVDNIPGAPAANAALVALAASDGSSLVGYLPAGTGAVATTVQGKLRESVSVLDFGADPTGVADSTTAINNALTASKNVYFPKGIYSHSGTLNAQIDSHIHGDGKIVSKIKYTGAGDAWNLAGGYTTFEDVFILGTPTSPRYFNVGTRGVYSATVGGTVVGINCRFESFATLLEGTGYYWKFYNCAFYSSQYAFNNMSANNLSFYGCAFSQAQNFLQIAPGAGPVSLFGCSIEAWSGVAIANVSGSSIALEMAGTYIENYPSIDNTGKGLGQFINAFLTAGDFSSISFHGNSVQCIGIRRVLYNTNATNAVVESSGNLFWYEAGSSLSSTEYLYLMSGGISFRANDAVSVVANAGYGTYTTDISIASGTKNISGINPLTTKALATVWTQITPSTYWSNTGNAGFPTLACKVENGLLHLQGQVACSNVAGTIIGAVPAAILAKLNCSSAYLVGAISKTTDTAGANRYRILVSTGNILVDTPTVGQWDILPTPWPINS